MELLENRGGSMFVVFVASPPQRIYTINRNKFKKKSWFITETENCCINEITSPQISNKPTIQEIWPHWNDSKALHVFVF